MKDFVKKHYKIWAIIFSVMAFLTFLAGNALECSGYTIQLVPLLLLVGMSFLGISSNVNMRMMLWIVMGVEFLASILGYLGVKSLYTYTFEWVLDDFLYYEITMYIVLVVRMLWVLWMPSLKKGLFSVYPIGMAGLYLLAAVLEGGISIHLISGVFFYIGLAWLAYDLTPMNRIWIWDRIWDGILDCILKCSEVEDDVEVGETPEVIVIPTIPQEYHDTHRADKLRVRLEREVQQEKNGFTIKGKEFLYDDYEDSNIVFCVEYEKEEVLLSAYYSHRFSLGVSGAMLKKKSILNNTFASIESDCYASVDLNLKNLEEGTFSIWLPQRSFDAQETERLVEEMFSFMKMLILLGNAKSY